MDIEKIEKVLYDNIVECFMTVQKERNQKDLILLFLGYDKAKKNIDGLTKDVFLKETLIEFERFKKNLDLLIEVIKNNNNNENEVKKINGIN